MTCIAGWCRHCCTSGTFPLASGCMCKQFQWCLLRASVSERASVRVHACLRAFVHQGAHVSAIIPRQVRATRGRPLAPGMYNVTASLRGYKNATARVAVPKDLSGAVHIFELVPLGDLPRTEAQDAQASARAAIQAKEIADKVGREEKGVVTRLPRKFEPGAVAASQGRRAGSRPGDAAAHHASVSRA